MRRQYIITFFSLVAAMLFAGCAKDVSVAGLDVSKPVQFTTSSVNEYVFKSTETALSTGDYIGVFAGSPISRNNVKMRVNGSALEYTDDADRIYWTTGQTVASNFVAYEPWIADDSFASLSDKQRVWTVNSDQSSDANFYASDLKVANVNVAAEADVDLVFNHILGKVTLTITSQLASPLTQVELVNVITSGTVDLDDGTISSPGARTSTVIAHQKSFNSGTKVYVYEAILIPDASAQPSIRITVEGGTTYTYTLDSSFSLVKGANATAAFTILRPGLSAVFSSMSVSSWSSGVAASVNTEGRSKSIADNKWAIVGNIMGMDWDEDLLMEYSSSDAAWVVDIVYNKDEIFLFRYNHSWDDDKVIGGKKSASGDEMTLSLNKNEDLKYRTSYYTYDGEAQGTKDLKINVSESGGRYRIYLHPYIAYTSGDNPWPTVWIDELDD